MSKLTYLPHAIIELTSECNLHCRHCYNGWKCNKHQLQKKIEYSYRKAFTLIEWLIHHTTVERIIFSGGEPTLANRFLELILHARVAGLEVSVITNGNGPLNVYKEFKQLGIKLTEVSIFSANPDIHDNITGVKGSWKRTIETLALLKESGVPIVPVIVITRLNTENITECIKFLHNIGLKRFMINRYNVGGNGLNQKINLSADKEELQQIFKSINDLADHLSLHISSGVCTPHCLLNPTDYPHIRFGNCPTDAYQRPLTFDIEGNIRLCNHSPKIVGNIFKDSFPAILFSEYVCSWENVIPVFCKECTHWDNCRGGCRAASEQLGGTVNDADPIIQEFQLQPFYL